MANLTISAVCNQNCTYCFAIDHLGHKPGGNGHDHAQSAFLPLNALEERLDFLARSGIDEVRLLGGEPTLHPQFPELVERILAEDLKVVVFTNGLMPETALTCLEALPPEKCVVLVNVNQPTPTDNGAHRRRKNTLQRLGQRALLGFNIHRTDFEMDFILPLITDVGCQQTIRLGMAQPCLSGENQYIHPNQYRAIAIKIVGFARQAANAGVSLDFDCGFVRCMFSNDDLRALEAADTKAEWRCNPILDVDIAGKIIHCYPLSNLGKLPLCPDSDATQLRNAFQERTRAYRQAGVFKECSTCLFKANGDCPGGCLAMTIRRFQHTPFRLQVGQEAVS